MEVTARKTGESDAYYTQGKSYTLLVHVTFWRKRVKIYHIHGWYTDIYAGSERVYKDMDVFESDWDILSVNN